MMQTGWLWRGSILEFACRAALMALPLSLAGCAASFGPNAENGITFYCPGAGNVDFGDAGIRAGLSAAGYKGEIASYVWTISFNPAIDQTLRINARLRASGLSSIIRQYVDQYPGKPVTVIGLSAGTGIALWALEDLPEGYQVDNVILLSSSLYHRYDISKAVPRIRGRIYNYYSPNDVVLAGPMKIFGTIDGVFAQDGAGAVGLRPPAYADRVVNVGWTTDFARYGYVGGHFDSTSPQFVRAVLAKHVLGASTNPGAAPAPATAPAKSPARAPRAAPSR